MYRTKDVTGRMRHSSYEKRKLVFLIIEHVYKNNIFEIDTKNKKGGMRIAVSKNECCGNAYYQNNQTQLSK